MGRRLLPAVVLFFLTPLIAEFLLGNLPASKIVLVLPLALMYGTGAVFIRELVRHTNRGWASLILLATAYGFVEEGLVTQSLFNPNYVHLRLLDYGYVPVLGTGIPWLVFVISLHVIWSIIVPIGLTEALFVKTRDKPWFGKIGLYATGAMFVAGSAFLAIVTHRQDPFMASLPQFAATVGIVGVLTVAAFLLPRRLEPSDADAPHPVILFLVALTCGSGMMGLQLFAERSWHWPWGLTVASAAALGGAFVGFMAIFTRNRVWNDAQRFALAAGGLSVYVWFGFVLDYSMHGATDVPGHALVTAVIVSLAALAGARSARASDGPS